MSTRQKKDHKPTTNDAGITVSSDEFSLTVGPDGPILLQDHYLVEQMANFNREMIPDRQPHAKGSGAFGHFEVTKNVSAYTKVTPSTPYYNHSHLIIRIQLLKGLGNLI